MRQHEHTRSVAPATAGEPAAAVVVGHRSIHPSCCARRVRSGPSPALVRPQRRAALLPRVQRRDAERTLDDLSGNGGVGEMGARVHVQLARKIRHRVLIP